MAAPIQAASGGIKTEENILRPLHQIPEASQQKPPSPSPPPTASHRDAATADPKDPENFLRRCSGSNKRTRQRCNSSITRLPQDARPTLLPTCKNHRLQKRFAGRCRFTQSNGQKCERLFCWEPPKFELCSDHEGESDSPCYLLGLPLELRYEIFRYLLPSRPIGSSTATQHGCCLSEETIRDIYPPDEELDEDTRMAMMPPELNESVKRALISVPAREFRIILRSYATHVTRMRSHGRSMNISSHPHSCVRCNRNPSPYSPYRHQPQQRFGTQYPMPVLDLLRICKQFYHEVKELLYSTVAFTVDICRDGTFMCGRRLLEPRGPDGSSPNFADGTLEAKNRFIQTFDWAAVKNYNVDIVVENQSRSHSSGPSVFGWDEEVEMYDIRDYVAVVVSGILGKARNLCKLQVRLCLDASNTPYDKILENTKLLAGPFERLRNVRQPRFTGVFHARSHHDEALVVIGPERLQRSGIAICSVPSFTAHAPVLVPGMPEFDAYATGWERCISSAGKTALIENPPIRAMFTEFKDFYSRLAKIVRNIAYRQGREGFLHRARVAREHEDVEAFRNLRNILIQCWYAHLEQEEQLRKDMNARMSRLLDTDIYPSSHYEAGADYITGEPSSSSDFRHHSSSALDADTTTREGIPMTGNHGHPNRSAVDSSWMYQSTQSVAPQSATGNRSHTSILTSPSASTSPSRLNGPPAQSSSPSISTFQHPPPPDDWARILMSYDAGGPGPSTQERRGGSSPGMAVAGGGINERTHVPGYGDVYTNAGAEVGGAEIQVVDDRRDSAAYVGKGKGKMVVE